MNKLFRNPHQDTQKIGTIPITLHYWTSKTYPKTCAALSDLAEVSYRDDMSKREGNEDYRASLEKLLHSLDTFIREFTKGSSSAGKRENYNLSNKCHFSLLLLWQIRNTITHQGGVIDQRCKQKYDRLFRKMKDKIKPAIDLPDTINVGEKFIIGFQDYVTIHKCAFAFFKEKVSEEDYEIFKSRAYTTNYKISNIVFPIEVDLGTIFLDGEKASSHGFIFDFKTRKIIPPNGAEYNFTKEKIYLQDGRSFSAKFERRKQCPSENDQVPQTV
ncbi:MAG: hypothetical protein WC379_05830 [Methanoregula sp.]|jgi:hypothetical protein